MDAEGTKCALWVPIQGNNFSIGEEVNIFCPASEVPERSSEVPWRASEASDGHIGASFARVGASDTHQGASFANVGASDTHPGASFILTWASFANIRASFLLTRASFDINLGNFTHF